MKKRVGDEEFVAIWQKASSRAEAAEAAGMIDSNAGARATLMRRAGVPLKLFKRGRKAMAVPKLIKIAKASLK